MRHILEKAQVQGAQAERVSKALNAFEKAKATLIDEVDQAYGLDLLGIEDLAKLETWLHVTFPVCPHCGLWGSRCPCKPQGFVLEA